MARSSSFWWKALRAVEAVRMQAARLDHAMEFWQRGKRHSGERYHRSGDSITDDEYRQQIDTQPFDTRPVLVATFALEMQVRNELELLAVAIRTLTRAQDSLPKADRPTLPAQRVLQLFRNLVEHPEDEGGRSSEELRSKHPEFDPDLVSADRHRLWIGGEKGGVLLSDIWRWAGEMETAVRKVLAEAGETVPELEESMVVGDDELAWPPERVAYAWNLPIIGIHKWPRLEYPRGPEGNDLASEG